LVSDDPSRDQEYSGPDPEDPEIISDEDNYPNVVNEDLEPLAEPNYLGCYAADINEDDFAYGPNDFGYTPETC
jgi:hypothetical protein